MKFYVLDATVNQESLVSELNPVFDLKILPIVDKTPIALSTDSTIALLADAFHNKRDVFIETSAPELTYPLNLKNVATELSQTAEDKRLVRVFNIVKESDDVDYYNLSVEMIVPIDEVPDHEELTKHFTDMVFVPRFVVPEGQEELVLIAFTVTDNARIGLNHLSIVVMEPSLEGERALNILHGYDNSLTNGRWIKSYRGMHDTRVDLGIHEKNLWEKLISKQVHYINRFDDYDAILVIVTVKYCLSYTDIIKSRRLVMDVLKKQLGEFSSNVVVLNKNELGEL